MQPNTPNTPNMPNMPKPNTPSPDNAGIPAYPKARDQTQSKVYAGQAERAQFRVQRDVIDSRELFRGRQELQISHEGEMYRLRVTRNGRLILNK